MAKIAILYIGLGDYTLFWDDFYSSSEKYLLDGHEKHFFFFTDKQLNLPENVTVVPTENTGWPGNSLFRYRMFLNIADQLSNYDYCYFFNANLICLKPIGDEFLPDHGEIVVSHFNYEYMDTSNPNLNAYDRNPKSQAFVPFNMGKIYAQGGLNGGSVSEFLKMSKVINEWVQCDWTKGIKARVEDESYLNRYIAYSEDYKILDSKYLCPWDIADRVDPLIMIRDKRCINVNKNKGITLKNKLEFKFKQLVHYDYLLYLSHKMRGLTK